MQDDLQSEFSHRYGHILEIIPHFKRCAGELFARVYLREFVENPENAEHRKKGSSAILARMKTELQGLKLWSCIYRSLEWRVYDQFCDPEDEESNPNETPINNTELISRVFKSLNLSWDLTGDYQAKNPAHKLLLAGPNINHNLPILTSLSEVISPNPDLPAVARAALGLEGPPVAKVSRTARIRLRIRIPPPQNSTGIPSLTQPTIIPTPGINVNRFEGLPYFLRFLTLR